MPQVHSTIASADSPAPLPQPWVSGTVLEVFVYTSTGDVVLEVPAEPTGDALKYAHLFRLRVFKASGDVGTVTLRPAAPQRIGSAAEGDDVDLPDSDLGTSVRSWFVRWAAPNVWVIE